MKLLGWMHRKFRQNEADTIDDFVPGQAARDDIGRLSYGTRPLRQFETDHLLRKSFSGMDTVKIGFCGNEGRLTAELDGLFHGFLTIGTLGSEPSAAAEEETPTFELSVGNEIPVLEFLVEDGTSVLELSVEKVVAEKETEITQNELNLINEELEKALMAVVPDEDGSSGRSSYVSTGRSSHASRGATTVCPLQGFLLGSAEEVTGIQEGEAGAKKEQRTTLEELFRITDEEIKEVGTKKGGGGDDADAPSVGKFAKRNMMKKLVRAARASKGSFGRGSTGAATSSETKLHKILHMFQKKVHPDAGTPPEKSPGKHKKVKFTTEVEKKCSGKKDVGGLTISSEAMIQLEDVNKILVKEKLCRTKCQSSEHTQTATDGNESNGSRECWIKTDEDYLVLEL